MEDYNRIAAIEQAVRKKYGDAALVNPSKEWSPEQEEEYLKQSKDLIVKRLEGQNPEKQERSGYLVTKRILRDANKNAVCSICNIYTTNLKDDLYLNRYDCCHLCYIKHIEDREERWKEGWRPNQEET